MDSEIIFEEYVRIVPSSIVIGNMLTEFFNRINVTNTVTVLYDDIVSKFINNTNMHIYFIH